jgi:hypothetical protein
MDELGWNDLYTWAGFRLENHSPSPLSFSQGPLDIERGGKWISDTNRIRYPFGPTLDSGKTKIVSMMPPEGATKWRTSFFVTRVNIPTTQLMKNKERFRNFMDKIGLHRFGMRNASSDYLNPPPEIVTSETIAL